MLLEGRSSKMTDFSFLYNRYLRNQRLVRGYKYQFSHPVGGWVEEPYFEAAILHRGDLFLDIGANVGGWLIPASPYYRKVIGFEPSPEVARVLENNLRLNKVRNAEIQQIALGDIDGTRSLYLYPENGHDSFYPEHMMKKTTGKKVGVWTQPLDSLNLAPSTIKIDTEGYEFPIILGGMKTLQKHLPGLCIETHRLEDHNLIADTLPMYQWTRHRAADGQVSMIGKSFQV
jgi:FkbM family methyltransferase